MKVKVKKTYELYDHSKEVGNILLGTVAEDDCGKLTFDADRCEFIYYTLPQLKQIVKEMEEIKEGKK